MTTTISGLYTYPLKSAKANSVHTIGVTETGLASDREFMLIHAEGPNKGVFISQRDKGCEKLALVETFPPVRGQYHFIPHDERPVLSVGTKDMSEYESSVRVWKDECPALDAGDRAAQWFSDYLGVSCRLVKKHPDHKRQTDLKFSSPGDHTAFADGFPVLITNTASLERLSECFATPAEGTDKISMDCFRPNIVISGLAPFEEDTISRLLIGGVELELVKPCSRCAITTIDQNTGEKHPLQEPLKSLRNMRRGSGGGLSGLFFGQNAIPRLNGRAAISLGQNVEILERGSPHPALENVGLKYGG